MPAGIAYADDGSEGLGVSKFLDDLFKQGENATNAQLENCEINGVGTHEECMALSKAGFEALQSSKDLAFSFHHLAEATIQFISPIQLGGFILAGVSAILGLIFFLKIGGAFGRHMAEIMLILFGIGLILLVLGDSFSI
jgi:hypothetical protein